MRLLKLWLFSIRDAFILLLPLVFFRSILQVIQFFPLPSFSVFMSDWLGPHWQEYLSWGVDSVFGVWVLSLAGLIALFVHQRLFDRKRSEDYLSPLVVVISALTNFVFYLYIIGVLPKSFIGYSDMLPAIISGLLTPFIYMVLVKVGITARSQYWYQQDVFFYRAIRFTLLFVISTIISFGIILLLKNIFVFNLHPFDEIIDWAEQQGQPIWFLSVIAALISQIMWFLGVHGTLVLDTYFSSMFVDPSFVFGARGLWHTWVNGFVTIGGSGATLGLVLAILLTSKKGSQRKVAYLGGIPSLFNINEIVLFGLPVVLNVSYLIPFIFTPILLSFVSIGAEIFGWVTYLPVSLSWTTPPLISGYVLTGSWHGVVLQLFEIILAILIYLPFVKKTERQSQSKQKAHFDGAIEAILNNKQPLQRHDDIGLIARNLFLDLQQGLTNGALSLVYQPKHDGAGRIVGVEALLRWRHEYMGNISPVVAVALAEEGGFIDQLGDWVINEACACKARWNRNHSNLLKRSTMAINVSPLQLLDDKLASRLRMAMRKAGIRPKEIEIEITESQSIPELPKVDAVFHALSDIGILLSIDDFGMGFASLRYLKRFKVDVIKIDGSITKDVLESEINRDIIKSITALGKSRGIKVVAEFVETAEQRSLLKRLGCDVFQGYFHSAPLSEDDLVEYVQNISLQRVGGSRPHGGNVMLEMKALRG